MKNCLSTILWWNLWLNYDSYWTQTEKQTRCHDHLSSQRLFTCYLLEEVFHWSCRSVYRRQDVCVAKVILWILSSCTYWWENRYPPILGWWPPIVGWWPPHTWLLTPPYLTDGPPILGWWPPHTWLMAPPYLADGPPHSWLMTPLPILAWCPPPWLDDVLSQVGFSSVCVKAGPHETCTAGTSFHSFFCAVGFRATIQWQQCMAYLQ